MSIRFGLKAECDTRWKGQGRCGDVLPEGKMSRWGLRHFCGLFYRWREEEVVDTTCSGSRCMCSAVGHGHHRSVQPARVKLQAGSASEWRARAGGLKRCAGWGSSCSGAACPRGRRRVSATTANRWTQHGRPEPWWERPGVASKGGHDRQWRQPTSERYWQAVISGSMVRIRGKRRWAADQWAGQATWVGSV
jgi:hypothetical protein